MSRYSPAMRSQRLQVGVWGAGSPPSGDVPVDWPAGHSIGERGIQGLGLWSSALGGEGWTQGPGSALAHGHRATQPPGRPPHPVLPAPPMAPLLGHRLPLSAAPLPCPLGATDGPHSHRVLVVSPRGAETLGRQDRAAADVALSPDGPRQHAWPPGACWGQRMEGLRLGTSGWGSVGAHKDRLWGRGGTQCRLRPSPRPPASLLHRLQ